MYSVRTQIGLFEIAMLCLLLIPRASFCNDPNITGNVTINNNAIEGVAVSALNSSNDPCGVTGITNEAGIYTVQKLQPGTYFVIAIKEGYDFTPRQGVIVIQGQTTSGINITGTIAPLFPTGILSGTVSRISLGTAIEGAIVEIDESNGTIVTISRTDTYGNYEIQNIPTGIYVVKVKYESLDIAIAQNVIITNGQSTTQNFSVEVGSISGGVNYSDQTPIAGATLMASKDNQFYSITKTNADGQYVFNYLLPGTYKVNLIVNGPFEQREINNITVMANSDITGQNFTITSVSAGQISGVIYNNQGPLVNAIVTAFNQNLNGGVALTNTDGIYTITGLPQGTYDVTASADNYVSDSEVGIVVISGQTSSGHNFTLGTEGGSISGNVFRSDGVTPISGAQVSCYSPGKSIGSAITDSSGAYSIPMLQAGLYNLTAVAAGYVHEIINNVEVTVQETNPGNNFTLDVQ